MENAIPRSELPRPDFAREDWVSLNGTWMFAFDDNKRGLDLNYHRGENYDREITVPFCFQSELSGINESEYHETVWYARNFLITDKEIKNTCLLKFGAVDYEANIWINGEYVGCHEGGHVQFSFDISRYLREGSNLLAVSARDDRSCDRARGKQSWSDDPDLYWYSNTTGIWQSVWLEFTGGCHLTNLHLIPDIDNRAVGLELFLSQPDKALLEVEISYAGSRKKWFSTVIHDSYVRECITLGEEDYIDEIHYWSPEKPQLYDITVTLIKEGQVTDRVSSYFGMRKIHTADGDVYLNNKLLYQRLVLDQGYWKESMMTPPSDEAIRRDVELTLKMGFNGVRKHQKFEDPRFYYWADRLGLLVWGELPSGYLFNTNEIRNLEREWLDFVDQTYNHPSVITWVLFNESWGVRNIVADKRQQAFASGLYYMTKAFDGTRPVSSNDGWEQVENTDLFAIHDYVRDGDELRSRYRDFDKFCKTGVGRRRVLAEGQSYKGQPFILSEFGGVAFTGGVGKDWGYNETAANREEFIGRIKSMVDAVWEQREMKGFCYTQLTDVMQEINGLLDEEHNPKVDIKELHSVFFRCVGNDR